MDRRGVPSGRRHPVGPAVRPLRSHHRLTTVATDRSTPAFAVSLVAIRRRSLGVSVDNVLGSNIYNVAGILEVSAHVRSLVVSGGVPETLAWLTVVSVLMVAALWTGRVLSRLEGALFTASEAVR